jgi:hypothetical protein
MKDKIFVQIFSVAVAGTLGCVGVSVAEKTVGIGVVVGKGCVGGIEVGGRNGVGVVTSPQAERMMNARINWKGRKKRL